MSLIHRAGIVMLVALAPSWAVGQADESRLKTMSVGELKSLYLACDRAAVRGLLGPAGIAQCSVIYEELKRQAFDGDFEKLLAWSRLHPGVRNTAR
jgi:hypothetical protein